MVAVHDEVSLLHGVARKEVGANALLGRELLQVVQVVNSGRESDLRGKVQGCIEVDLFISFNFISTIDSAYMVLGFKVNPPA